MSSIAEEIAELKVASAAQTAASQALSQEVAGKMGQIDQKTHENTAKVDSELAKIQTKLSRIVMTRNQELDFEGGFPKSFAVSANVTIELYLAVTEHNVKSPDAVALLQEVMQDTGFNLKPMAYYRRGFNVIKISWVNKPGWLCYPHAADDAQSLSIPLNTFYTLGSFTKILSGGLLSGAEAWAKGAELGKWKFCNFKASPSGFGAYSYLHPIPSTPTGEMLVFLPAAITGHIDDGSEWFPNIKIGN
ncbi:hypothetical protein G3496_03500 [Shewanella baltica]|uniref:hypothetical protein n=1 Tax=Shewanella baltica TaxID=62322 RepID=UPI00217D792D|nr:hypothetical protein [Shewanella baltica]MCS6133989.1 hypothetical protein [Shewanella baltica]